MAGGIAAEKKPRWRFFMPNHGGITAGPDRSGQMFKGSSLRAPAKQSRLPRLKVWIASLALAMTEASVTDTSEDIALHHAKQP